MCYKIAGFVQFRQPLKENPAGMDMCRVNHNPFIPNRAFLKRLMARLHENSISCTPKFRPGLSRHRTAARQREIYDDLVNFAHAWIFFWSEESQKSWTHVSYNSRITRMYVMSTDPIHVNVFPASFLPFQALKVCKHSMMHPRGTVCHYS